MMSNRTQTVTNAIRVIVAVVLMFNALIPIVASASNISSQQQEQHVPEVKETNSIIQWFQHIKPF